MLSHNWPSSTQYSVGRGLTQPINREGWGLPVNQYGGRPIHWANQHRTAPLCLANQHAGNRSSLANQHTGNLACLANHQPPPPIRGHGLLHIWPISTQFSWLPGQQHAQSSRPLANEHSGAPAQLANQRIEGSGLLGQSIHVICQASGQLEHRMPLSLQPYRAWDPAGPLANQSTGSCPPVLWSISSHKPLTLWPISKWDPLHLHPIRAQEPLWLIRAHQNMGLPWTSGQSGRKIALNLQPTRGQDSPEPLANRSTVCPHVHLQPIRAQDPLDHWPISTHDLPGSLANKSTQFSWTSS